MDPLLDSDSRRASLALEPTAARIMR